MAFALQKRCSTAELSRHWGHRKHQQGQFQSAVATGFGQGSTDVTFDRSWTDHQPFGNGLVAEAFQQQRGDSVLCGCECAFAGHGNNAVASSVPRR